MLVPIGTAELVEGKDVVRVPLTAERFGLLPIYEHRLTRTHELEVRRHFSLGEAAAAAVTGTTAAAATGNFYDDEGYDDRRFFGARRPTQADELLAARRVDAERDIQVRERVDADRDIQARESEIRVPVDREDAVVLKRGEDGRDEIIIRRPIGEKRVEP